MNLPLLGKACLFFAGGVVSLVTFLSYRYQMPVSYIIMNPMMKGFMGYLTRFEKTNY